MLPAPSPEAQTADVTSDAAKLGILWSTHEPGQHQMLARYDRVLTEIMHILDEFQSGEGQRPAAWLVDGLSGTGMVSVLCPVLFSLH